VLRALLIPVFMAWLFMILEADRAAGQARLSAARNDALVLGELETRRQLASTTLSRNHRGDTPDKKRLLHIEQSVNDTDCVLERCVEVAQHVDHHLRPC
jgi:hypothetical protein